MACMPEQPCDCLQAETSTADMKVANRLSVSLLIVGHIGTCHGSHTVMSLQCPSDCALQPKPVHGAPVQLCICMWACIETCIHLTTQTCLYVHFKVYHCTTVASKITPAVAGATHTDTRCSNFHQMLLQLVISCFSAPSSSTQTSGCLWHARGPAGQTYQQNISAADCRS